MSAMLAVSQRAGEGFGGIEIGDEHRYLFNPLMVNHVGYHVLRAFDVLFNDRPAVPVRFRGYDGHVYMATANTEYSEAYGVEFRTHSVQTITKRTPHHFALGTHLETDVASILVPQAGDFEGRYLGLEHKRSQPSVASPLSEKGVMMLALVAGHGFSN